VTIAILGIKFSPSQFGFSLCITHDIQKSLGEQIILPAEFSSR
jgi:hypothetical protein